MLKNFSLFLALRYLRPRRTYVSIITLISIVGVTLGVTVLIIVIGVMTGFEKKLQELILGFEPHIRVAQYGGSEMWDPDNEAGRWDSVQATLKTVKGVQTASPYVMGQVLLRFGPEGAKRQLAMMMMGIDDSDEKVMRRLGENVREDDGEFDLGFERCVVSKQFAQGNSLRLEDRLEVLSTGDLGDALGELLEVATDSEIGEEALRERVREITDDIRSLQAPKDMAISGVFDSMSYVDFLFVPLYTAQELYDLGGNVHGIAVDVPRPLEAELVKARIDPLLPPGWYAETWIERHEQRFATVRNERAMMYFVLFFIVLVAAFSTMNTMITMTVQKRHEIGVMKALGARVKQIVWVFLGQGMIVGLIGSLAGLGLGTLMLQFRNQVRDWLARSFGLEIFPEEMYGVAEIPAKIVGADLATICIGAFVLCTLAALPPAWMVARLDPAKALRE